MCGISGVCEQWEYNKIEQFDFNNRGETNEEFIGNVPWGFLFVNWVRNDQHGWGVLLLIIGIGRQINGVCGSLTNRFNEWLVWGWRIPVDCPFSVFSHDVVSIKFRIENFNSLFFAFDMIGSEKSR